MSVWTLTVHHGLSTLRQTTQRCTHIFSKTSPKVTIMDSKMLRTQAYVGGEWIGAISGKTFEVKNPSNGEVLAAVPDMNIEDTEAAIGVALDAFKSWKKTTVNERSAILRKWYELIVANTEDLATILTKEMGKPLAESKGEIGYGAGFVEWFSQEARRSYGDFIPSSNASKRIITMRQPVGVAGLITPWNFPHAMITRKVAPAMAAGCTVVLRPAEDTPLSALALCELAQQAGIPKGVFNVVTSDRENAPAIGNVLCKDPRVAKISFTGSTAVGKILLKQAADTVKRVSMELGGNAPYIVFESANVDKAVSSLMPCKFRASGQTCVCANRIFVQEGIYDEFVEKLQKEMSDFVVGDGLEAGVTQGPLVNERAADKVEQHVVDAVSKGGKVLVGGKRHSKGACFFEPTLITGGTKEMRTFTEEVFGPVAVLFKFKTEEEVIELANAANTGLAGYFFSNDLKQIWRVAENIETGMVCVNDGMMSTVEAPFGGVKESGIGREGSKYGLDEFTEIKYFCFADV